MLFVCFSLPGMPDRSGTVFVLKKYLIRLCDIASDRLLVFSHFEVRSFILQLC